MVQSTPLDQLKALRKVGNYHLCQGNGQQALATFRHAATLSQNALPSMTDLGHAYYQLGHLDDAAQILQQAMERHGPHVVLLVNRANVLGDLRRWEEAKALLEQAIDLYPHCEECHSNLLSLLTSMEGLEPSQVFAAHRHFGQSLEGRIVPLPNMERRSVEEAGRKIRIGYLSPALYNHIMIQNLLPVLEHHDRERFEVHVYAHVPAQDNKTNSIKNAADRWTEIHALSDPEVARRIRADGIDILVHTMGHWAENRICVFAYRSAPVQVSYLYQSPTTGMTRFDALLANENLDGGLWSAHATERIVHLKTSHVTVYEHAPPLAPPPSEANGFITFGSFNAPRKIGKTCLDAWAATLRLVPDSRLLLKGRGMTLSSLGQSLRAALQERDIDPGRIELMDWVQNPQTMFNQIDIHLDSYPFNGGRTTEDALWMGVPVVSLSGGGIYSRMGKSNLLRLGLSDLCAESLGEFASIAARLAADRPSLSAFRSGLRHLFKQFHDPVTHVRELENIYLSLWQSRK
ncbi:putative TPR domain/SEC-C motif domain protein [Rhodospirillaceae bacterium LM-1]|nr:putative TPR domain/SEC-C motif domain protein [Rhodospirillaceae bacterium LM-1]